MQESEKARLVLFEDGLDGERRVEAGELHHGVRHAGQPVVVWLYDDRKALVVCAYQRPEIGD